MAGGLVAVLALVALFLLGTRIPDLVEGQPIATPTPTPTPTPTDTPPPKGPVEPGVYRWDELLGGECFAPYIDAWQDEYTVVDCALPHSGQLVFRGSLDPEQGSDAEPTENNGPAPGATSLAPYPGEAVLSSRMTLLCAADGAIDAAASAYDDLLVQGAYPVSVEQWRTGYREYSCWVSRASGEAITGSLAVPLDG